MKLLVPHLLAARDVIDRCDLWINTDKPADLEYLNGLCGQYPGFFQPVESRTRFVGMEAVSTFYTPAYRQPGTVYLKVDDDIVWMDPEAIRTLIRFRVSNPEYFLVSANVWNNQLCDHLHQRCGLIPAEPFIEWNSAGSCWRSGKAAEAIHRILLSKVSTTLSARGVGVFERYIVRAGERLSINMVAWLGEDLANLGEHGLRLPFLGGDEDFFSNGALTMLGKDNAICGGAVAAHFAFGPQRAYMDGTDLLVKWAAHLPAGDLLPEKSGA